MKLQPTTFNHITIQVTQQASYEQLQAQHSYTRANELLDMFQKDFPGPTYITAECIPTEGNLLLQYRMPVIRSQF